MKESLYLRSLEEDHLPCLSGQISIFSPRVFFVILSCLQAGHDLVANKNTTTTKVFSCGGKILNRTCQCPAMVNSL